jgi:hypothetical protein
MDEVFPLGTRALPQACAWRDGLSQQQPQSEKLKPSKFPTLGIFQSISAYLHTPYNIHPVHLARAKWRACVRGTPALCQWQWEKKLELSRDQLDYR